MQRVTVAPEARYDRRFRSASCYRLDIRGSGHPDAGNPATLEARIQ
jgi:hypothetical protein